MGTIVEIYFEHPEANPNQTIRSPKTGEAFPLAGVLTKIGQSIIFPNELAPVAIVWSAETEKDVHIQLTSADGVIVKESDLPKHAVCTGFVGLQMQVTEGNGPIVPAPPFIIYSY